MKKITDKERAEKIQQLKALLKEVGPEGVEEAMGQLFREDNQRSLDDFLGLSPNQVHQMVGAPYGPEKRELKFHYQGGSQIEEVPIIKQSLFLLDQLKEAGGIKATAKGFLPRRLVQDFYHKFLKSEEELTFLPYREEDSFEIVRVKQLLMMAGAIKNRKNRYSLTKKGLDLLEKDNWPHLYQEILEAHVTKFYWGFADGYPEFPFMQQSFIFNLYLLSKKAGDWVLGRELGEDYLRAFPMLVEEVDFSLFSPEDDVVNCFYLRFLQRFCLVMGILEEKKNKKETNLKILEEAENLFFEDNFYRVTPFFQKNFHFDLDDLSEKKKEEKGERTPVKRQHKKFTGAIARVGSSPYFKL